MSHDPDPSSNSSEPLPEGPLPEGGSETPPAGATPPPMGPPPGPTPRPQPAYAAGGFGPGGYPRPAPRPRRGPGAFFAFLTLGMSLCCLFSLFTSPSGLSAAGGGALLEEVVEGSGTSKVALIELNGVIARVQPTGGLLVPGGVDLVQSLQRQFDKAAADSAVRAVLLQIDSPGGGVTASDQIWHMVQEFRKQSAKPVVIHMGSLCCSGGYYVAVAGDKLVCEPTTITGSIGVLLGGLNVSELMEQYGVEDVTITSGPNKDLLSPTREVRPDHLTILQATVDSMYERFVKLVAEGRGLDEAEVRAFADGRIMTAQQALDLKMVDQIGYRSDSFAAARTLGGIRGDAQLVRYSRPPGLADLLAGASSTSTGLGLTIDRHLLDELTTPRAMAIWRKP